MEDKYETMNRDELLRELRGLLFRYEQFRNTTLPALNGVTAERDALRLEVARLEARIDQIGADFTALAELQVRAQGDPRAALAQLRILAIEAYERVVRRDYFTDDPLDD